MVAGNNLPELYGVAETLEEDTPEKRKCYETAIEALNECMRHYNSEEYKTKTGWKKEASDKGDVVYSRHEKYGKLFAMTGIVDCNIETLFKDAWYNIETLPSWNTNCVEAKVTCPLGAQSEVLYQAMADVMIVTGRDFTGVRIWRKIGDTYVLCGKGVEVSFLPKVKGKVRAVLHLAGGRFVPVPGEPNKTEVQYLACLEFKGMIPQGIVNAVCGKMMLNDITMLRKHAEELAKNEA